MKSWTAITVRWSGGASNDIYRAENPEIKTGHKQHYSRYQAQNCNGCPMRGPCHKAKGNRVFDANTKLIRYKQEILEKLNRETGLKYRSQRPVLTYETAS